MIVGENLLSEEDAAFLKRMGWECEVHAVGEIGRKELLIVTHDFSMPEKYQPRSVDLLMRQLAGYPETGMDMFWTRPEVTLVANGTKPDRADVVENYIGLPWQRWSRHLNGWRSDIDNLETFFRTVIAELNK